MIKTTKNEQDEVAKFLKQRKGEMTPMSLIAKGTSVSKNRVRYVIDDLVAEGRIKKIPVRELSPKYIRYKYEVIG
jgi:predicted HTH transcriptional regulator